jgi:hypothetical protein
MLKFSIIFEDIINPNTIKIDNIFDSEKFKKNIIQLKGNSKSTIKFLNKNFSNFNIYFLPSKNKEKSGFYQGFTKNTNSYNPTLNKNLKKASKLVYVDTKNFYNSQINKKKWGKTKEIYKSFLGHELIHRKQNSKIKNKEKLNKVQPNPDIDYKGYLKDPHEIMTYAYEFIRKLKNKGYDNDKIKNILRFGGEDNEKKNDVLLHNYKKLFKKEDPKIWKQFITYGYQYLNNGNKSNWITMLNKQNEKVHVLKKNYKKYKDLGYNDVKDKKK